MAPSGCEFESLRNRRNGEPKALSSQTPSDGSASVDREAASATEETSTCVGCSKRAGAFGQRASTPSCLKASVKANQCEREAVDKVLGEFSELRVGAIWARLRRLRYQRRTDGPLAWTNELDERLVRIYREAGIERVCVGYPEPHGLAAASNSAAGSQIGTAHRSRSAIDGAGRWPNSASRLSPSTT